jgi:hypothetical protein
MKKWGPHRNVSLCVLEGPGCSRGRTRVLKMKETDSGKIGDMVGVIAWGVIDQLGKIGRWTRVCSNEPYNLMYSLGSEISVGDFMLT